MASFNIHLAIGKKYVEKHSDILSVENFYRGVIAPDLVLDKNKSHYSSDCDTNNLVRIFKNKVDLYQYLRMNTIDSDYQKGVFLHLLTDYLFFNCFFDLANINDEIEVFVNKLYYSYRYTNDYLKEKYHLDFPYLDDDIKKCITRNNREKLINLRILADNVLPYEKLDEFVEWISSIDLYRYAKKILNVKTNVKPE